MAKITQIKGIAKVFAKRPLVIIYGILSYTSYSNRDDSFAIACHRQSCIFSCVQAGNLPNCISFDEDGTCPAKNIDYKLYTFFAFNHFCPANKKGALILPTTAEAVATPNRSWSNRAPPNSFRH